MKNDQAEEEPRKRSAAFAPTGYGAGGILTWDRSVGTSIPGEDSRRRGGGRRRPPLGESRDHRERPLSHADPGGVGAEGHHRAGCGWPDADPGGEAPTGGAEGPRFGSELRSQSAAPACPGSEVREREA